MNESPVLVLAWAAGAALGGLFFGGLWWTLRRGLASRRPATWLLGGMLVRVSIALAGFYLVGQGAWHRMAACLVGFVMARLAVAWLTRPGKSRSPAAPEASHAP